MLFSLPNEPNILKQNKDVGMGGVAPEEGWAPQRGDPPKRVWQHSRPLLPAETSATAVPDLAVVLNSVLPPLFVGEAQM